MTSKEERVVGAGEEAGVAEAAVEGEKVCSCQTKCQIHGVDGEEELSAEEEAYRLMCAGWSTLVSCSPMFQCEESFVHNPISSAKYSICLGHSVLYRYVHTCTYSSSWW